MGQQCGLRVGLGGRWRRAVGPISGLGPGPGTGTGKVEEYWRRKLLGHRE